MSFSNEQLSQRLRNLATDKELSGDAVNAKWLNEAAARLLELSTISASWHPSLTSNPPQGQVINIVVKNPWTGEVDNAL